MCRAVQVPGRSLVFLLVKWNSGTYTIERPFRTAAVAVPSSPFTDALKNGY